MKDQETKDKFVELRVKGMSFNKIAKELNTSKQTLINWSKEFEHEINNLKAIELEALCEKYYMAKEKRIEYFGEKIKNIKVELEKRIVSDLSTKELYTLMIKIDSILQREKKETIFKKETYSESLFDIGKSKTETWEA